VVLFRLQSHAAVLRKRVGIDEKPPMRDFLIHCLACAALVVLCLPVVFIVTLLLLPLWSWIESTYGIESVGHSGPADWCFWLVFEIIAVSLILAVFAYGRRPGGPETLKK